VTLAAFLVIVASLLLVASVFERLGSLHSLESRTAVERFLREPPGSDLGLGTEAALDILRTLSMVAAGLATAAAILGYHVLKRNKAARVGLTVLALPLFLCGLVTGGFLASVVAASVAMLWLAPARHWFSGEDPLAAAAARAAEQAGRPSAPSAPPTVGPSAPPPQPTDVPQQPPPWTAYGAPVPWPPPTHAMRPPRRPSALVAACAITWACCALTALVSILLIGVMAADADGLIAEMHRQNPQLADQGVSDATLHSATWAVGIGCLAWSLVSVVLAVLAFHRVRWAAIGLICSACTVAVLCLVGSLISPSLAAPGVLAAVAGVLLLQSSVHRWFDRSADHTRPSGMMR
jgi:hypothetical protein